MERDQKYHTNRSQRIITQTESAFLHLLRNIRYGSIENFLLVDGEPIVGAETEVCTEYKLSGVEQPWEVIDDIEFLNKPQVRTMLERFKQVRSGKVEILELRDGLPARLKLRNKALS